jgi:hypothetical protein
MEAVTMKHDARSAGFVLLALALLGGCAGTSQKDAGKAATPPDRIQGKAQVLIESGGATDQALNAGGSSMYLWVGLQRYRLYLKTPVEIVHGKEYVAEGVYAQKVIEDIGDPDGGRKGYPLDDSCRRVVLKAWPRMAFDEIESSQALVKARVKRYPARPLFLVTKIREATAEEASKKVEAAKNIPEVDVAAEKQRALLTEGAVVQPAPMWEPNGGTVSCKLLLDQNGKVEELDTGKQLCEAVPWATFTYKPTLKSGKPVKVRTEVEIKFEPRKT